MNPARLITDLIVGTATPKWSAKLASGTRLIGTSSVTYRWRILAGARTPLYPGVFWIASYRFAPDAAYAWCNHSFARCARIPTARATRRGRWWRRAPADA